MSEKILSIFIDESGDFGRYDHHAPNYYVAIVMHEQWKDIMSNIRNLDEHIINLGYEVHAIHTAPIIRRESFYKNDLREQRRALFNALYHFARKLDIHYICPKIKKIECRNTEQDSLMMEGKLSKIIADELKLHYDYISGFDKVIVYYDNGQMELNRILVSVFNSIFINVEFRKIKPVDYKLSQVADLICTMELLKDKADRNDFSVSESEFFGTPKDFKKNIYKNIVKKHL
ncbi:MAG: DUF3800 domain-containing protein [Lachnospiraceae bacterium]|nr:DUF3800 domain-containing protein [Lachnospiraceae bacterium]